MQSAEAKMAIYRVDVSTGWGVNNNPKHAGEPSLWRKWNLTRIITLMRCITLLPSKASYTSYPPINYMTVERLLPHDLLVGSVLFFSNF